MQKSFKLILIFILLIACKADMGNDLKIKMRNSVLSNSEKKITSEMALSNTGNLPVRVIDYRMNCECVTIDQHILPFTLAPHVTKAIPVSIFLDSSDFGSLKQITVTCKLAEAPYFVSKTFYISVESKH